MSRAGMVIMYTNCTTSWRSSMQMKISPSTVEATYVALSSAMRQVLPLVTMMDETNKVFPLLIYKLNLVCKVHKHIQSCIKLANGTIFSPRTKHIALKYHHFRYHVKSRSGNIHYKPINKQLTNILTKPLSNKVFFTLCSKLSGWDHGTRTWPQW